MGKTKVITERTKYLITTQCIHPSHILVITFTKAAAAEMKERFYQLMNKEKYPVTFGTFHAVFFQILKHAYGFHGGNIIREEQRFLFMREIIQHMHLEYEDENEFIKELLGEISLVKNTGILLKHYFSKNCAKEVFEQIYQMYDNKMRQHRLIDFDDMLIYCYELFDQRKDILSAWQQKFQYILIDEFQDINKIQFEIIKMLALPENNLFVVGDDDQSIYRFRGAKPELMLGFEKSYPKAKRVLLDINYRSHPSIVEASKRLISHNTQRFQKEIRSYAMVSLDFPEPLEKSTDQTGIYYHLWADQQEEANAIIKQILKDVNAGHPYEECAVLFRTNIQPRVLISQLMAYNIPFRTKDNIPNLYEHWITKSILTYIRLAQGSRARRDILQIMNRPNRYITRESLPNETVSFEDWTRYFYHKEQPWVAERIEQLESDLELLGKLGPYAALTYIRKGIDYEEYLKKYAEYRKINVESLMEILEELQESSKGFQTYEEWFAYIENYTKELQKQQKQQELLTDCISLATLHSAKGLEYSIVHILDVNEGLMPYKKAVLDTDLQEERRMFYVGITRTKETLHIHSVKKYNGHKVEKSRYIKEMRTEILQMKQ